LLYPFFLVLIEPIYLKLFSNNINVLVTFNGVNLFYHEGGYYVPLNFDAHIFSPNNDSGMIATVFNPKHVENSYLASYIHYDLKVNGKEIDFANGIIPIIPVVKNIQQQYALERQTDKEKINACRVNYPKSVLSVGDKVFMPVNNNTMYAELVVSQVIEPNKLFRLKGITYPNLHSAVYSLEQLKAQKCEFVRA